MLVFMLACQSGDQKVEKSEQMASPDQSTLDIDPRLKNVDSLVVVFYKDPYGSDSLRYTRYYSQASTVADEDMQLVHQQLTQRTSKEEKYRSCRSEGKIWCYADKKIFQTVYFSTRRTGCQQVYIIKDGFFYYAPPTKSFATWLDEMKSLAKEP